MATSSKNIAPDKIFIDSFMGESSRVAILTFP